MSELDTAVGPSEWDARVTRFEIGAGWSPVRRVILKGSFQHNSRDGGRIFPPDRVKVQGRLVGLIRRYH